MDKCFIAIRENSHWAKQIYLSRVNDISLTSCCRKFSPAPKASTLPKAREAVCIAGKCSPYLLVDTIIYPQSVQRLSLSNLFSP